MRPSLGDLTRVQFDVTIIGGGINGTEIAHQAARAGYRTLLVEKDDFAAGTTSRATRLIHGGLRYLEHGEFGLVYESLAERETLVRRGAHLVRPLRLLVPVYRGDARPPWKVRAGLALYDALSFRKSLPRHRAIPLRSIDSIEPGLARDGLRAAFTFYDAQVEFPERLVIDSLRGFVAAGGIAMNHCAVRGIVSPGGTLRALVLHDAITGDIAEVETKVAVNAAGPWVDEVLAGTDAERHERLIGGTKGSHLVAEWPDAPRHAIFATAKSDDRPFFILPWYRYTLVGTTDIRYDGTAGDARCTPDELAYLLDEASALFPRSPLRAEHVLYTYSGVRPLPYTPRGTEAAITRRHFLVDHVKRGGPAGLLTVVGGKLTTYRSLARMAMPAIRKHISPSGQPSSSEEPAAPAPTAAASASPDRHPASDPLRIYGAYAAQVAALRDDDPALARPVCQHNPESLAQVAYAVEHEHAITIADVLLRRLPVGWSACGAIDGVDAVAAVIAKRLHWPDDRIPHEIAAYEAERRRTLVPVSDIGASIAPAPAV